MKKEQIREKILADIKESKQLTFDKLPKQETPQPTPKLEKFIDIAQLSYSIKENELEFSIAFGLLPSKNCFSNLMLELYFDNNKLNTFRISVPPSKLLGNELEFPVTLDMTGICPSAHTIKVEMYEQWKKEKLFSTSKYVIVQYSPTRREDRYVKVPIVRKIDGVFRIILPEEKALYEQFEKSRRREIKNKRDHW